MDDDYFGPGYEPPTDPGKAALDFQLLLLEAGAQIRDTIPGPLCKKCGQGTFMRGLHVTTGTMYCQPK
jgi:hypothetical protein